MKLDQLTEVFVKQVGARKEGNAYLVPGDADASIFVALEGETLSISKISRLEIEGSLVSVETSKHERYVVAAEDVRAVKIERGEQSRRGGSAGFSSK